MKLTDFARTLTGFLSAYLPEQRNVSTNTVKSYRGTFKQLLIFFDEILGIKSEHLALNRVTVERVKDFLIWLEKSRCVSINTCNQRLAAIHSFFRYVQSESPEILFECQRILGIPFKKRKRKTINYLTQQCLKALLEQPDITKVKGRRDLTMTATLYDTGAQV